jgi:DNA-binding transcriptional regulator YdaS (Cro superfamily)
MEKPVDLQSGVRAAITAAGGNRKLAQLLGVAHQPISKWTRIPAERLIQIEKVTDVPREKLRPDLYRGYARKTK